MKDYPPKMAVAADVMICAKNDADGWDVVLIRRKNPPYQGSWAIPGGFVEMDETVDTAAVREIKEEAGVDVENLKLLGIYSNPTRDPRGRTISGAYYTIVKKTDVVLKSGSDAAEAKWHTLNNPPELAFDHQLLLDDLAKILG